MKGMITHPPSYCTFLWWLLSRGGGFCRGLGIGAGLTFDAKIHNVVTTDGTVVYLDVPGPESDSIPLFNFETRL